MGKIFNFIYLLKNGINSIVNWNVCILELCCRYFVEFLYIWVFINIVLCKVGFIVVIKYIW